MSVLKSGLSAFFILALLSTGNSLLAGDLTSAEIRALFAGKTAQCIKSKDFSTCDTYMGENGEVKRFTHKDSKLKTGTWDTNDKNQLCIKWKGKKRAQCFIVIENSNGTHRLVKRNKTKSVIAGFAEGNTLDK